MKRTVPALLTALLVLVAIDLVLRLATPAAAQSQPVYPRQLVSVSSPFSGTWHYGENTPDTYVVRAWSDGTVEAFATNHTYWKGWKEVK